MGFWVRLFFANTLSGLYFGLCSGSIVTLFQVYGTPHTICFLFNRKDPQRILRIIFSRPNVGSKYYVKTKQRI